MTQPATIPVFVLVCYRKLLFAFVASAPVQSLPHLHVWLEAGLARLSQAFGLKLKLRESSSSLCSGVSLPAEFISRWFLTNCGLDIYEDGQPVNNPQG